MFSMTTWQDIASARGFENLGNGRWLAPNGQQVAEGFVAAVCRPELVETQVLAFAPTVCQRTDLHVRRHPEGTAGHGTRRQALHGRRHLVMRLHGTLRRRSGGVAA